MHALDRHTAWQVANQAQALEYQRPPPRLVDGSLMSSTERDPNYRPRFQLPARGRAESLLFAPASAAGFPTWYIQVGYLYSPWNFL
ncbi:unnamed protein product [Rhizoctonia solani]|uniref:Uncharacterized protein n=1 Tax=Rhizoctonia solani TaxID=456999 RepID=A0A8H3H6X8_9AGAM|nr:unnamed protein product [Rhizoctonia solani]